MKLKEILSNVLLNVDGVNNETIDYLSFEDLLKIKDTLLKCNEFNDVDLFEIINIPCLDNIDGELIESKTIELLDNLKFKKRCYLHSVTIIPKTLETSEGFKVFVRGIFEEIDMDNKTINNDFGSLNLNYKTQSKFSVFYLEENGKKVELKLTYLSIDLKENFDLFNKDFHKNKFISKKELNEFLLMNNCSKI
jgi:hypothetical protein